VNPPIKQIHPNNNKIKPKARHGGTLL
jgi:hypothetical protein